MKKLIGSHDLLFVTLDTLRYDVAAELMATGRTPNLARALPGGRWERRHSPASFTYAAHQAFFAGFLPTPTTPGPHPRLFAAAFPGSESTTEETWVFDAPDVVAALNSAGYHTVCIGGVGFFNLSSPLGRVLPALFAEAHWEPEFGVTSPACFEAQLDRIADITPRVPERQPLFLFVNIAAMHQPNRHYLPGAQRDSRASHAAALEYVDRHIGRLFALATSRGRPCLVLLCSDHGTAYGEEGHIGHRFGHDVVWTVPYAQFVLEPGDWGEPGDWQ
ncbi:MAG TPA: STM4013/SEN3800 family hydrolase [Micromonospora sp.]|nr:STM4013/SEN3800 family hydrolase [Micromonospora sp.]